MDYAQDRADFYPYKIEYPFVGPPHNLWVGPTNGLHLLL